MGGIQDPQSRRLVYGITVGTGALSYHRGQLAWFKHQGWDVTLVTRDDPQGGLAARREGVPLIILNMVREIAPAKDFVAFREWLQTLKRVRPHAVNVSTPKAGLLGGMAAWLLRIPKRLYIVRGLRIEGSRGPLSAALWIVEWLTQHLATDVIYVSESLAQEGLRRRLAPARKSWLIGAGSSNGVHATAVAERVTSAMSEDVRANLRIPERAFVVGFVGRLNRDKGVDTLLRFIESKKLNELVHLLVVGPVEDSTLHQRLADLPARVTLVDWTDDVWWHLAAMDVLVLPTRREGFPNVVLEAAAAGIPAITTRATGAVDSVIDGETGYIIDVNDANALVAQINHLATSAELLRRLGENARVRAVTEFPPERIWKGLASILEGTSNEDLHRLDQLSSSDLVEKKKKAGKAQ